MKCVKCGTETEKRGRNQKYCPRCAKKVAAERQRQWRESHGITPLDTTRQCKVCGATINPYRHYCDNCLKEKNRTYQREYARRIRAESRKRRLAQRENRGFVQGT